MATSELASSIKELESYLASKGIPTLMRALLEQLCLEKPAEPIPFMVAFLNRQNGAVAAPPAVAPSAAEPAAPAPAKAADEPMAPPRHKRRARRGAVSAETGDTMDENYVKKVIPKTAETRQRLEKAVENNLMFAHLDDDQKNDVFDAMFEKTFGKGDVIIKEGDDGDNFYVVESGHCEIYKGGANGAHEYGMLVFECGAGGSFGELALIHGSPRAATVIASQPCRTWAIDRVSYRHILMDTTLHKRRMYEKFLENVPILASLTKYERLTVSDALEPVTFHDGDVIMAQGDKGEDFFIIESGTVIVKKWLTDKADEREVTRLEQGKFFGEIALLTAKPRAATCIAQGIVKCVRLDTAAFTRVLGPAESILRRNLDQYNLVVASL